VTFARGDIATYDGKLKVEKMGAYRGVVDFDLVAAWLDSQDVDRFAGEYGQRTVDGRIDELAVTRAGRTLVIRSNNINMVPVGARGIMAAVDGFADGVLWRSSSALDPYFGYFSNESSDNKLTTVVVYPQELRTDAHGFVWILEHCSAGGTASISDDILVRRERTGVRAWLTTHQGGDRKRAVTSPIAINARGGTITVGNGDRATVFQRVSWREYESKINAFMDRYASGSRPPKADCAGNGSS
jgi:hypothetical protein